MWTDDGLSILLEGRREDWPGGPPTYVMQQLSELVDGFILEHLRVNEDSCGR